MNKIENLLISYAKKFGITDNLKLAHLLAQCSHESANFTKTVESFNYSPQGLMATWKIRFDTNVANNLGRTQQHPAKQREIANIVYNGRMGNALNSNDGYNYRGRGYIQITGKDNYTKLNAWLKSNGYMSEDIISNPALLEYPELAALSAVWFWIVNNIGELAKKDDVVAVTKKINGGTNGLDERKKLTDWYKKVIGSDAV